MSINRREEILARLLEIMETFKTGGVNAGSEPVQTVVRNRGLLQNDSRPAFALIDGSEASDINNGRGRPGMSQARVIMRPQIFGMTKSYLPKNEDANGVNVGTIVNMLRGKLIRAIADDVQLKALIGTNGDINYDGMETDLSTERPMLGEFRLDLAIRTILNPYA